jgi:NADH dehydrogenase
VRTLTNSGGREHPFGDALEVHPYRFDRPEELTHSLAGAEVLYNTYWVRFDHKDFNHGQAVRNTLTLFEAAKKSDVKRVVHVSITNPDASSDLPYFKGKAELEQALMDSGMSYAILRPTVLFGKEDILINNIAWMLRRFPVFGVFGDGHYKLQPIHVDDLAELAVEQGGLRENRIIDAIGPETFTYRELVQAIGKAIGKKRPIVSLPPSIGLVMGRFVGFVVRDVLITPEEIQGLMENRLVTSSPPAGSTRLTDWMAKHAGELGARYSSELARRRDRSSSYEALREK